MLLGICIVLIFEEYTGNNYQVMTAHHVARSSPKMRGENGARSPGGYKGRESPPTFEHSHRGNRQSILKIPGRNKSDLMDQCQLPSAKRVISSIVSHMTIEQRGRRTGLKHCTGEDCQRESWH